MNIRRELEKQLGPAGSIRLNDVDVDPRAVRAVMINEVVPKDADQDFYCGAEAEYAASVAAIFGQAGAAGQSAEELLRRGIYLTNAVKTPKTGYTVEKSDLEASLPWLEAELALFPETKVVMLMGDVAKKAYNMIVKKRTKRNVIPSGATYRLRGTPYYDGEIRVMPSYIMTGGNILIEKSKVRMITEDIAVMEALIR